jgi:RNA polymerase sigma factor (sigma-70 family)
MPPRELKQGEPALSLVGAAHVPATPLKYGWRGTTNLDPIHDKAYGIARAATRDPHEGKAIATEVMLALWTKGEKDPSLFDRPAEVAHFAAAVTLKKIADWRRVKGRLQKVEDAVAAALYGVRCSPYGNPYEDAEESDRMEWIDAEIAKLEPRCRQVAQLMRNENMDYAAIAKVLGTTVNAVTKAWSMVHTTGILASQRYDRAGQDKETES